MKDQQSVTDGAETEKGHEYCFHFLTPPPSFPLLPFLSFCEGFRQKALQAQELCVSSCLCTAFTHAAVCIFFCLCMYCI